MNQFNFKYSVIHNLIFTLQIYLESDRVCFILFNNNKLIAFEL